MNCQDSKRDVERSIVERQRFRSRLNGGRRVRRTLREHDSGRLDGNDAKVCGLVRSGPRTDVDGGIRIADRRTDHCGDARIRPALSGVCSANLVVCRRHAL
jgi:hypothetical protein